METVVVERDLAEPLSFEELEAREKAFAWCLEQHRVRYLRTFCSRDRRRMICVYEAPDAEAVREVQRTAGMPFSRIWSADVLGP